MAKGQGKGSEFERKICKILSLWWSNNERDDIFWRTSQSGGRATERKKKGMKTAGSYGDMTAIHESGKDFERTFLIEFKKGYNKDVGALMLVDGRQKEPALLKWWIKNEKIKRENNRKFGILIFERNRRHPCIMMDEVLFGSLEQYTGNWTLSNLIQINFVSIDSTLIIVPLYPFLEWCSSESMKLFIEGENNGRK